MKNKIYYSGIFSSILIVLSGIFKINHWPGAGVLLSLSVGYFCLIFLPMAFISCFKGEGRKHKFLYIAAFITVFVDFTGAIFKVFHWPGASIIMVFGITLPVVLFLPVYLYFHFKEKTESLTNFLYIMFLLVYLSAMSALLSVQVGREVLTNAVRVNNLMENASFSVNANKRFVDDNNTSKQAILIDLKTTELVDFIHDLKVDMILASSKGNKRVEHPDDLISSWKIIGMDNSRAPRKIMGSNKQGKKLKSKVENYKQFLLDIIDDPGQINNEFIEKLLSTEDVLIQGGEYKVSWESYYFEQLPMILVISNLTQLENKLRLTEAETLRYLQNKNDDIDNTQNLGLSGLSNVGSLFLQFTWSGFSR